MKKHILRMLAASVVGCFLAPVSAYATDWYVDGLKGSDSSAGTSSGAAFKNPWKALAMAKPGDTVRILPTIVYSASNGFDNTPVNLNHGGTPDKYITIIGGDGSKAQRPTIRGTDNFGVEIDTNANYVLVTNLDVAADNAAGKASWYGIYVNGAHHVIIRNNSVHDAGGGGIGTNGSDYINIDTNVVWNTAWNTTSYCGSGISIYHMTDIDVNYSLKNQIKNNTVYMNGLATTLNGSCNHSDGNGIIVDDGRHTQSDKKPYKSATYVYNNVIAGNGGRGVEIFNSDNVTVIHNTTFHNMQDLINSCYSCGEINVDTSNNVKIYNNILFSNGLFRTANFGTNADISVQRSSNVTAGNNMMWNDLRNQSTAIFTRNNTGTISLANGNVWGDPVFTLPVLAAVSGNFRPMNGSKAFGAGNPANAIAIDMRNSARNMTKPTVGAYE